jgi:hypothetical protein
LAEKSDKELATGLATLIRAPVSDVVARLKKVDPAAIDPDILVQGDISASAGPEAFERFAFRAKDKDEAEDLLEAEPGGSVQPVCRGDGQAQGRAQATGRCCGKALMDAASREYREILFKRWRDYRQGGLAEVSPYVRKGQAADLAAELRLATTSSQVLAKYFPQLQQGLLKYPAGLPTETEEKFRWLIRRVEDRPTLPASNPLSSRLQA